MNTARLTLKPWCHNDADLLHRMWTEPQVRKYLWDDLLISRETAIEVVNECVGRAFQSGIGMWNVWTREAAVFAGFCGLRPIPDSADIEIYYGLRPEFWGRGYATEASRAVLEWRFRHGPEIRIYARSDPQNLASIRVMERLGMTFLGEEQQAGLRLLRYVMEK